MTLGFGRLALYAAALGWGMAMTPAQAQVTKTVVLVGASIEKAWHFDQLARRQSLPGYDLSYVGNGAFDKSPLINEIVARKDRPGWVAINSCSTYFPGDPAQYHQHVEAWVAELRRSGIRPVLVTTAPVGAPPDLIGRVKTGIKRFLGMRSWLDHVTDYNDWLHQYAARERIPLFDLEAVLRVSDSDRYLKPEYDVGDLVHLTPAAYKAMDKSFVEFLQHMDAAGHPSR